MYSTHLFSLPAAASTGKLKYNRRMRKFIVALIMLLGVVFLLLRFSEVEAIVITLQNGDIRFIVLALAAAFAWIAVGGINYKYIYAALGLKASYKNLLPVSSASIFLNIIAPSAGMSGMAVFIAEAHRRGYSKGRAALAEALNVLFEYTAFICVLALGLFVLFRRGNLQAKELIASAFLILIAGVLSSLVYLGVKSGVRLGRALAGMARLVNKILKPFIHREYLSPERAYEFAFEASEGLHVAYQDRKRLLPPLGFALLKQALLICILWLSFLSFGVPTTPGTLIASFSIAYLFLIVSPTPAGLGFVEGVLPLALTSMYVDLGQATIVTLTYRTFTFWVPLLVGMFCFRSLGGSKGIKTQNTNEETKENQLVQSG